MIRILSIDSVSNRQPTAEYGQYDVKIEVDGSAHHLEYSCDFREDEGLTVQSVTWEGGDAVLADLNVVDVSVVTAITDTVVQYHRTISAELPRVIEARSFGPDTTVIKL